MNTRPIEEALDKDLRLSHAALLRAAKEAHRTAKAHGTLIVVSRNGVVVYLTPNPDDPSAAVEAPSEPEGGPPR